MTVGEMLNYTNRFKTIVESSLSEQVKSIGLAQLMTELERIYQIPMLKNDQFEVNNPHLMQLYKAVSEARAI